MENKMKKTEIVAKSTDMYIGAQDARLLTGSLKKESAAKAAIAAKPAVKEVKDKEGKVTTKAVASTPDSKSINSSLKNKYLIGNLYCLLL